MHISRQESVHPSPLCCLALPNRGRRQNAHAVARNGRGGTTFTGRYIPMSCFRQVHTLPQTPAMRSWTRFARPPLPRSTGSVSRQLLESSAKSYLRSTCSGSTYCQKNTLSMASGQKNHRFRLNLLSLHPEPTSGNTRPKQWRSTGSACIQPPRYEMCRSSSIRFAKWCNECGCARAPT